MTKIENKPHLSNYPTLSNYVRLSRNEVKAFIPFTNKFTFLQAKEALRDLKVRYVESKGVMKRNRLYIDITLVSEAAFNIHAIIEGWNIKNHQKMDDHFNDLYQANPLIICRHLDKLVSEFVEDEHSVIGEVIAVAVELRRAYMRYFSLKNNIDLGFYLDEEK